MSLAHLHAAGYLRRLREMPGVELLASDPDAASRPAGESGGRELASRLGVDYVDSYVELLDWRPDGVLVCSENARHRELVELGAAAGASILCEKPLATSLADGRAMLEACVSAGVWLMMAHPVRFSPAFAACRAAYASGALGQLLAVTGTNNGKVPTVDRAWFVDEQLAGGGALMDHVVHLADLLDALLSADPVSSVYATTSGLLSAAATSGGPRGVETGGLVSLRYASGVIATFDCSWSRPPSSPTWGGLTLSLVGSDAVADLDAFGTRVDGEGTTAGPLWLPYGPDLDALLLAEFVDALATGRSPQPDGAVGLRTLEIVLAGYASVRSGQPVDLSGWRDGPTG